MKRCISQTLTDILSEALFSKDKIRDLFCLQDEAAEVAALLAAENVALVPESERDRLGPLDALTGAPLPDDVLLFALPVRITASSCVTGTGVCSCPSATLTAPQCAFQIVVPQYTGNAARQNNAVYAVCASTHRNVDHVSAGNMQGCCAIVPQSRTTTRHHRLLARLCAQVCAPYSALQGYKLKVKLTPGAQKKGKGGRQARSRGDRQGNGSRQMQGVVAGENMRLTVRLSSVRLPYS